MLFIFIFRFYIHDAHNRNGMTPVHFSGSTLEAQRSLFLSLPTIWHSLPLSVELERVSVKSEVGGDRLHLVFTAPIQHSCVCAGIQTRAWVWVSSFLSLNQESGQCRGMIFAIDVYQSLTDAYTQKSPHRRASV